MNIFLVNILGVSLIAAIVWWFWLSKSGQENQQKKSDEKSDENEMSHH